MDVYAPGDLIAGAGIDGKIVKMSGTNVAAPLVSGLVAALLSLEPDADLKRVKEALVASFAPTKRNGNGCMPAEPPSICCKRRSPMPKLSSNSLNGLVSELNGFHQHAHRFETLDQTFGILPKEGLEFAALYSAVPATR